MSQLLIPDPTRAALFPIRYPKFYEAYKNHVAMFWHSDEIDFKEDAEDWRTKLSDKERDFISHVLAFFASSETTVMDNLVLRFMKDVPVAEVQHFYAVQLFMESIHSETYSRMIDILWSSMSEKPEEVEASKNKLFSAVTTVTTIKDKCEWSRYWIDEKIPFAERLIAFIALEGIGFVGSFASIFWLKKRGILPGVCFANELIARDEGLHRDFGIMLYHELKTPVADTRVQEIITSFVQLEINFVQEALHIAVIGMNAKDMEEYIKFIGDYVLKELHVPPVWNAKNPFPWMVMQGMDSKTNFFEKRVSNYRKAHTEKKFTVDLNEAFDEEEQKN